MPNYRDEKVTYSASLLRETERAWLFIIDDDECWIPKSVAEWNPSTRNVKEGEVTVPVWFAEKEGLA